MAKKRPVRDRERSRRKFIDATIRVLRRDGPSGLTTGRIAKAAGLSQPSFYMHFEDMDDALRVVSEEVASGIRQAIHEARQHVEETDAVTSIRRMFEQTVNELVAQPELTELFLRHKNDSASAVGKRMRKLHDTFHADLVADLEGMGLRDTVGDLETFATFIESLTLTVVERIISGQLEDRDHALALLTESTLAMRRAFAENDARRKQKPNSRPAATRTASRNSRPPGKRTASRSSRPPPAPSPTRSSRPPPRSSTRGRTKKRR